MAAYGIPTIGPPCLAGSSVVNMPIAQMSGPQSIGSSVPSSVPIINPSLPGKTQMTTALSNTINTMSTNNNNTNTNNNSNGINNNMKQNVNNNTNDNNNNSNPSQTTETNEKTENTESSSNGEGGIKNTQKSKIVKSNKDGQDLSQYQPEPLNVGAIEQKHDGQAKQVQILLISTDFIYSGDHNMTMLFMIILKFAGIPLFNFCYLFSEFSSLFYSQKYIKYV